MLEVAETDGRDLVELFFSSALMFFLVMDPLGNIPLFLTALRGVSPERRQKVILREILIALVIMVLFLFLGKGLLQLLHVEQPALMAAGGVILLLIAIRMIFPSPQANLHEPVLHEEPFIVPLAVPYLAGPSLLAIEVVIASNDFVRWPVYLGALVAAWAVSAVILYFSGFLQRVLGERAMTAIERLMGMILVIVATQMMMDGARQFLHLG